nr:MAG TPA: hypothetical protein [Caudoviricetes sp.]
MRFWFTSQRYINSHICSHISRRNLKRIKTN